MGPASWDGRASVRPASWDGWASVRPACGTGGRGGVVGRVGAGGVGADPVEHQRHDLGRRQRPVGGERGVADGEGQRPQVAGRRGRREPHPAGVGGEQCGQGGRVGRPLGRVLRLADRRDQVPELGQAPLDDGDRLGELVLEGQVGVDGGEGPLGGLGVEGQLDRGAHDRVLVGEGAEDRAFGDAGRLGDLAGGDGQPVLQQERQGGGDDGGPPLSRGEGGRAASTAGRVGSRAGSDGVWCGGVGGDHGRPGYMSENSLIHANRCDPRHIVSDNPPSTRSTWPVA